MTIKRPSIIAVTEKGTTRYGIASGYGGLASIALRLLKNAYDKDGNAVSYFERLDPITEVKESVFQDYTNRLEDTDELLSFAEIDVDKNVIRIDEDRKEEREYHEYPLDRLLEKAARIRRDNGHNGYTINKEHLYGAMNATAIPAAQKKDNVSENCRNKIMERLYPEGKTQDGMEVKGMELG